MSKEEKEAPRGFSVLVQQIDDGSLHAELSETMQKVSEELAQYADDHRAIAKGSVTLTLTLAANPNGTMAIISDVKTKLPKAKRAGSIFWLTPGNNLSPENPRQTKLPLREVPAPEKVREINAEKTEARTV